MFPCREHLPDEGPQCTIIIIIIIIITFIIIIKKQAGFAWNFSQPQYMCLDVSQCPISKWMPSFSVAPSFWRTFKPPSQDQQNGKKKPPGQDQQNSKQWQLPSWYSKNNFKDTFPHICIILLRALSQSGIVEFSVEPIYPNMENFPNSWYSDYWKVHLQGKKLNLGIYQTAAKQNSPTGSYHTQPWMQILPNPGCRYFLKISFPLSRRGSKLCHTSGPVS